MPTPPSALDPLFAPLLLDHDIEHLDGLDEPAYGFFPDGRLGYFNPRYAAGACSGSFGLGRSILDGMDEPFRRLHRALHREALESGKPVTHRYQCPTPSHSRELELRLHPLRGALGLLAIHSVVWMEPHPTSGPTSEDVYRNGDGLLVQCASCRRTLRADRSAWDVVPTFIAASRPRTSHGLCPTCAPLYFAR